MQLALLLLLQSCVEQQRCVCSAASPGWAATYCSVRAGMQLALLLLLLLQ
jgi:hypothetical protein